MANDRVRTTVDLEGAEEYDRKLQLAERFLGLLEKGVQKTDKAMQHASESSREHEDSLSKLADISIIAKDGIGSIYGAMQKSASAAVAVAGAVRDAGEALYDLGMRGGDVSAVGTAFERIADQDTLRRLHEASGGLVDNVRLMREYTQATRAHLATEDEIVRFYRAVTRGSQDAGESVQEMLQGLGSALSGGGLESFARLGVPIAAVNEELRRMGLSMESVEGRSTALDLILARLEESTGGLGNESSNLNDAFTALDVSLQNQTDSFARAFSEQEDMLGLIQSMTGAVGEDTTAFEYLGSVLGATVAESMRIVISLVSEATGLLATATSGLVIYTSTLGTVAGVLARLGGPFETLASVVDTIRSGIAEAGVDAGRLSARLSAVSTSYTSAANGRRGDTESTTTRPRGGRGGGGGQQRRPTASIMDLLTADLEEAGQRYAEEQARVVERLYAQYTEEQREYQRQVENDLSKEAALREHMADVESQRHDVRMRELEKERDAQEAYQEYLREQEEERWDRAISNLHALADISSTLGDIFGQIADEQEAAGRASDGWRKAQGIAKGTYYAAEAVATAAEAVRHFASHEYASGALAVVSAAQYGVASGYMFSKVAQSGSAGLSAPQASAGSFVASRPERLAAPSQKREGDTVNVYSLGSSNSDVAAAMERARYDLVRSGRTPVRPGASVGYLG